MVSLGCKKGWAGSSSFILSRRNPARKKVVGERCRETNSCICLITGSKDSVCVPPLSLACSWPVTNSHYKAKELFTSKPKCNLRIFLNTRLQAMTGLIVGVSALFGDWIVNSWRTGCHPLFSLYGTYSSALLRWKLRTMTVFSLRSACCNFLLGEEIKAPVLSLCSQTERL